MKKLFSITLMIFAIVILWHGCTKPEEAGTIYGTVTDFATGVPLSYVQVTFLPSGWTALTGADGTYQFEDLKPGQYSLSVLKTGYVDLNDSHIIELASGENVRCDVLMQKIQVLPRITDMNGNDITVLDFGTDQNTIAFNIINIGSEIINCQMCYECQWISSVSSSSVQISSGQVKTIIVSIDRTRLAAGENSTNFYITSEEGSNVLVVKATRV